MERAVLCTYDCEIFKLLILRSTYDAVLILNDIFFYFECIFCYFECLFFGLFFPKNRFKFGLKF